MYVYILINLPECTPMQTHTSFKQTLRPVTLTKQPQAKHVSDTACMYNMAINKLLNRCTACIHI